MDRSEDGSLDETLPSGDYGASPLRRPTAPVAEAPIAPGTYIGRYRAIEPLGSGTMGVVMLALDATLDRKVAIKLVRPDSTGTSSGKQRLLREAQAMAKLSHPNVVTVFEVGTFEDRVFLAMEYVAGSTLSEWLKQPERTQREKIAAFVAAGHGLAAAHRAGIVHRDFKPSNVLVDGDGRVRVADFGLATAPTGRAISSHDAVASDPTSMDMTSTGVLLGTPAYMSPEQHRGEHADARADQFAFCVALYEALYRQLPFTGSTFLEYQASVLAGQLRDPPRGIDVPAHVQRALVRGLSVDPARRYPRMDALLVELARDPRATRIRVGLVVGAVALAGTLAFVLARRDRGDPCATAAAPFAGLWDAGTQTAFERSFTASKDPVATSSYERVAKLLDARANGLRLARREACVATAVSHEQSEDLLDRRMQCLDQRAAELRALIAVLSDHPTADTIAKSIDAARSLPPLETCSDRASLLAEVALPPAAIRDAVAAHELQLDRVQALLDAGKAEQAVELVKQETPEIERIGHLPQRARLHLLGAKALVAAAHKTEAVQEFKTASELAAGAKDDRMVARAMIGLYGLTGSLDRIEQARGLEPSVSAAVIRAGNTAELRGLADNSRGIVELAAGNYPESAARFQAAAKQTAEALGPDSPVVINQLSNAGIALNNAGKFDDAKAQLDRVLALRIETVGPDHPSVSTSHYELGSLLDHMGQPDKALAEFQSALALDEKVYSKDSPHLAHDLMSVGVVLLELKRGDEALASQQRAVEIMRAHSPEDLIIGLMDLGNTYRNLGKVKESLARYKEALDTAETKLGKDHPTTADVLGNLAYANYLAGDKKQAVAQWQRALDMRVARLGPDHPDIAKAHGTLANAAFDRKDYVGTMQHLDAAVAILDKQSDPKPALLYEMLFMRAEAAHALHRDKDAVADATRARDGLLANQLENEAASVRIDLADALWATGRHREAIAEARATADALKAAKSPEPDTVKKVHQWLAHHH